MIRFIEKLFGVSAECPFCGLLVERNRKMEEDGRLTEREPLQISLARHIRAYHFPSPVYHCTKCLRIMTAHDQEKCSPPMWIPCDGGKLIETNPATEGYPS